MFNKDAAKKVNEAAIELKYSKEDLRNEETKQKLNSEHGDKSQHRLKLEKSYQQKGMSVQEAEIAAYRRAKAEKALLAIGVTAAATATAYALYKHYDRTVDKIITKDKTLQRIAYKSDIDRPFYTSMKKADNNKYRGFYAKQLMSQSDEPIKELKIGLLSDVKVASEKSAVNVLKELADNDPDYKHTLIEHFTKVDRDYYNERKNKLFDKAITHLTNGKVNDDVYRALNVTLVDHTIPTTEQLSKSFYDKLKSKGYDAIIDFNDKKMSNYNSSKPMIIFNTSKTKLQASRTLGEKEINRQFAKEGAKGAIAESKTIAGAYTLGILGFLGASKYHLNTRNNKIVREYKKEHPNTNLSYNEIVRNYERERLI